MSGPLAGLRIVATIPPHPWFGGIDYNFAIEMADDLRLLGADVFELDVAGFHTRNRVYCENAIAALKTFRPDVAISLPNSLYALHCATPDQKNVFKDVLGIPTLMLWDHGLLQFPRLILGHHPYNPAEALGGAIRKLRRTLNHPLYVHYSPDRGHIEAFHKMGVIDRGKVTLFLQPAYPNFVRYGYRSASPGAFRTRLAFAGNVYLEAAKKLPFQGDPALAAIESRVLQAKKSDLTKCLWDLFLADIDALDRASRRRLRLDPGSTFFWNYLHEEIEMTGNTEVRLSVLTGLKREYDFYGNFVEPASVETLRKRFRVRFKKCLDYFTELPLLFMNSELIVDVINLGYNSGISPKVMGCLACGGLVLFDYKEDFHRVMGGAGDEIMYRSVDHLNGMIDGYLSNPRKRRDVARHLQHRVATEFSFAALARRILIEEPRWRR